MPESSIENQEVKQFIITTALHEGFCRARILSPYNPIVSKNHEKLDRRFQPHPALLMVALAYGNQKGSDEQIPPVFVPVARGTTPAYVAPFAQRNYYAEAVYRLQNVRKKLQVSLGGSKEDYAILCNSPVPEKPLAIACGLGWPGRNSLVITPEAGSLVILAGMTLPFTVPADAPLYDVSGCKACEKAGPACVAACPGQALQGDGNLYLTRCIQWYASGNEGSIPDAIQQVWGNRLYGCTICQDVCPYNKRSIIGIQTIKGFLPATLDAEQLLKLSDTELKTLFKGTTLGMRWLSPEIIRRTLTVIIRTSKNCR